MSQSEFDNDTTELVSVYVSRLTGEELMLITLKKELYEGCWDTMLADLKNRLEGRPYIFKLANRITDDIKRIEKLRFFEQEQKVDLADFVNKSL